jgi:GTPase Era involved in 16S rRNA processing
MKSTFLSLNTTDFLKGLVVAVLTSVLTIIYTSLQTGSLVFDWKTIATTALTSAIAYVSKNLLTNSKEQFLIKEQK